jgi:hypothetical protein
MNKDITDNISYPIRIQYESDKVVPMDKLPERIRINATGFGWKLLKKSLFFQVDPVVIRPDNLPDRNYITANQILPALKQELSDIRINYIISDTIYLNFEHKVQRKINLALDTVGLNLAPGHRIVSSVSIEPDSIVFSGPASIINEIPDTIFLSLNSKNIKEQFSENVKIDHVYNATVKYEPKEVKVKFNTALFLQDSKVINLKKINFPQDTSYIVPDRNVVLNYVVRDDMKQVVSNEDFKAIMNFKHLNPKDTTIKPELVLKPDFIKEYFFTPSSVKVKHVKKTS